MTRCARPIPPVDLGSSATRRLPATAAGVDRTARRTSGGQHPREPGWLPHLTVRPRHGQIGLVPMPKISVFLADDNLIVREGVRALIGSAPDLEVVGVAGDYDELVKGAEAAAPQV